MQTWSEAMAQALYASDGFYRREQPADHFRTSVHASPLLAGAIQALITRVAAEIGDDLTVVDVGAGGGELLAALAENAPPTWRLVGVELRPRPQGLPSRVEWAAECEYGIRGMMIAHELLDNIPVDVVQRNRGEWSQVLVDVSGEESVGPPATPEQLSWLQRWWPDPQDGDRAEVGLARDRMWADHVARLDHGLAVAVDYELDPARMRDGTLAGYRGGRQVEPIPDGSCDLTAHVHFEAVAAAGLPQSLAMSQRELLASLGISAERPSYSLARSDPLAYLQALSRVGELSELTDPTGLGGFTWLLHGRGVDPAALLSAAARD